MAPEHHFRRDQYLLAWILLAVGAIVAIVGIAADWSARWFWFDEAMHFLLMFAAALVACMSLYGKALRGARGHPMPLVITIVLVGTGLGAFWEIGEWLYERLFTDLAIATSKQDTMIDLLLDALGAFLAGLIALRLAH